MHSTETTLLKVTNDIMIAADEGKCSVLVLLDLMSAFDTVDHSILLNWSNQLVGISGTALEWFSSYPKEVFQLLLCSSCLTQPLCLVVLHRVLCWILHCFPYTCLLSAKLSASLCGVSYHFYADDIQLFYSFKPGECDKWSMSLECIDSIKILMTENCLQFNENKTEALLIAPDNMVPETKQNLGFLSASVQCNLRNSGVIFDQSLSFENRVSQLFRSCVFQLKNIAKLRSMLTKDEMEMIILASISSRLDYCNTLFICLKQTSVNRLQTVQNAAAWILTRNNKRSHITLILSSLHWLPINFHMQFKILDR